MPARAAQILALGSRFGLALACAGAFVAPGCAVEEREGPNEVIEGNDGGLDDPTPLLQASEYEGRTCTERWEELSCGESGVQFCDLIGGELTWGPCMDVTSVPCDIGEFQACDWDDPRTCQLWGGVPSWSHECAPEPQDQGGDTPLVLRFDDQPVTYTAFAGVGFDISGRGCDAIDWPTSATPWLAIDLDHSGTIDGGHELFGSGTVLDDGRKAQQGFEALAMYDANRDGRITPADPVWARLVLWADHDGDRVGQTAELEPLANRGVTELNLEYRADRLCDARGNCGVERASFSMSDSAQMGEIVDVHLACQ